MNINPLQLIQVTFYSKIINEFTTIMSDKPNYLIGIAIFYMILKFMETDAMQHYIQEYYNTINPSDCSITIPYHKRNLSTMCYGVTKENVQINYSNRFHALNYYLSKHAPGDVNKMVEILKREYKNIYFDSEVVDYILLPSHNQKIEIHKELGIFFEIIVEREEQECDDEKKGKKKQLLSTKNYIYRISKAGKHSYPILKEFLDNCVTEFENETMHKNQQKIFEFMKSEKDEDVISLLKYPFQKRDA
jgi:hypothetical protein